jgi:trigger factor
VEIPESMTRIELDSRWRNLARQLNTDAEGLYKMMGGDQGANGILESWKPEANKALHSRLIVETLMNDLKLEASDEEAEQELQKQADEAGTTLEEIKKYYENEQMKEYLKEDVKEKKLFERLLTENTVKPGKKQNYVDLTSNNG